MSANDAVDLVGVHAMMQMLMLLLSSKTLFSAQNVPMLFSGLAPLGPAEGA